MLIAYIMAWFNAKYANRPTCARIAVYQATGITDVVADDLGRQYLTAIRWFWANDPGDVQCPMGGCDDCVEVIDLEHVGMSWDDFGDSTSDRIQGLNVHTHEKFCWGDHPAEMDCECQPF